jgi:hypothetical protein
MSEVLDINDEEMLARLAACDLTAAERVHSRLMAAEEASDIAELGRTYQRIARSLRQTLALKARFKREREQAVGNASPIKPSGHAVARRIRDLREAVTRVIWNEAEPAEYPDYAEEALDELIAEESRRDDFCAEALDDHVARVCDLLDLSPEAAARWRDLPDPDEEAADEPPPEDPPDRSSSG